MIIRESNGTFDFCFKMKKNLDFFLFYVFVIKSKNEFQISISIFNKVRKMNFCLFFYEIFSVSEQSSDQSLHINYPKKNESILLFSISLKLEIKFES